MRRLMRKSTPLFLTLLLTAAIGAEQLARPRPRDAEPFHARVRDAEKYIPDSFGEWEGQEVPVDPSAVMLLQPNVVRQRRYVHRTNRMSFVFLLVQCRTARDMGGHYPPVCYPAQGYEFSAEAVPGAWRIGNPERLVSGMDYSFRKVFLGRSENIIVRNLIIMPDGTFARDTTQVRAAAADYMRQFYGAAQIQLVFNADAVPPTEREAVFSELMAELQPLLDALTSGDKR